MRPLARRTALLAGAAALLAGCGEDTWLGENKGPPLPGKRKPVLLIEDQLTADPRLSELKVVLPPPVRNPDWPQVGGSATRAMQHLDAADTIELAWRTSIGTGTGGRSLLLEPPIVAGGKVFAVDAAGEVSAHDAATGERGWRFLPEDIDEVDRLQGGAVAYEDGKVFLASAEGTVLALDAGDGKEIWRQALGTPIRSAPSVARGHVLVPSVDSQLFALDAATGEVRWRHSGLFEQAGHLGGASPAISGDIVVAAYPSGEVVALSLASGQVLWGDLVLRPRRTLAIGALSGIVGDPVIDGDRVLVAGASGEMAAFDLERGDRLWATEVTSTQTPWVAGDFIYALTERNELVCLLRQGGRVRWVSPLGELAKPEDKGSTHVRWSGPLLVRDRLLAASSLSEVASISPYTGELLGKAPLAGPVSLPPVVAGGVVYFLTDGGELLAYR